ncbi:hypothetical protein ACRALDRAFT_1060572 [Sodiomyces alcalophilus JCM 7366]|uniref:uncharacterized protein n=1 Tax=Sodiomyces alcalophilus JCM 7366 TaxID=591952 RepID=UPI0039B404E9
MHPTLSYNANPSIGHVIVNNATTLPRKTAVIDDEVHLTYEALHRKALALATKLVKQGVSYETPVAILTRSGAVNLVAQVGIVYAGGTCVPLDLEFSRKDVDARLQSINAKHLVVDKPGLASGLVPADLDVLEVSETGDVDLGGLVASNGGGTGGLPKVTPSDFRTHILFTSGSTGPPKAVQLLSRGLQRISSDAKLFPDARNSRFADMATPTFDLSILGTWAPLLNGASIVYVEKKEAMMPETLEEILKTADVNVFSIAASVFSIVALSRPTAFSTLDTLIVAGEPPNIDACRAVLESGPPKRLLNGYGPTECSVLTTTHEITLADLDNASGFVPIGTPINQTVTFVLDENLQPVKGQNSGELFVGGPGVARGYLNDVSKTKSSFVQVRGLHAGEDATLYRTGDIVFTDKAGRLVWQGRADREVKLSGYRVQLDVVEAELLLTGMLEAAVAFRVQLPGVPNPLLMACVSYKGQGSDSSLMAEARTRLPKYMVPYIVSFDKLPLNRNGKIDRKRTEDELIRLLTTRRMKDSLGGGDATLTGTESKLKDIWSSILLAVAPEDIHRNSDFFALGGTSLDMASMLAAVRETFNFRVPSRVVYEAPDIASIASEIDKNQLRSFDMYVKEIVQEMKNDAESLGHDIPAPAQKPVEWLRADEGRVFLTGSTGFVGAYLLVELLRMPETKAVRCLVRAPTTNAGFGKLMKNLKKYRLEDQAVEYASKIQIVLGDLDRPNLGLDDASFNDLANWTSVIFHLAALVDYNRPYGAHFASNILGTLCIMKLAVTGRPKGMHYSGSISTFGASGMVKKPGERIREEEPLEEYFEKVLAYETGYAQSQAVADQILWNAMKRGVPVAVYRFGFVLSHSKTGMGNPDDFVARTVVDCMKIGTFPDLPRQRKELLPVDYAASAVLTIAKSNDNLGRIYHVTPDDHVNIDSNSFYELMGELSGRPLRKVSYWQWLDDLKKANKEGMDLRLKPLFPMLEEPVLKEFSRWEIADGMAHLLVDNTKDALKRQGPEGERLLNPPVLDKESLQLYLRNLGIISSAAHGELAE